jgi:hypothetical protein
LTRGPLELHPATSGRGGGAQAFREPLASKKAAEDGRWLACAGEGRRLHVAVTGQGVAELASAVHQARGRSVRDGVRIAVGQNDDVTGSRAKLVAFVESDERFTLGHEVIAQKALRTRREEMRDFPYRGNGKPPG